MSGVNIQHVTIDINLTETNAFAPKPVTMLYFVAVPIDSPLMKEGAFYRIFGQYADARAYHSAISTNKRKYLLTNIKPSNAVARPKYIIILCIIGVVMVLYSSFQFHKNIW